MNNDYSFINSSDTSEQLALLDEFFSENYEFRHNVLSDVYEIRELPRPLLIDEILKEILAEFPSIRTTEGIHVRLGKVLKAQNFERKRMAVLWQIMAGEISSAIIYNIELQYINGNLWQMADFSLFSSYSFRGNGKAFDSSYKTHFVGGLLREIKEGITANRYLQKADNASGYALNPDCTESDRQYFGATVSREFVSAPEDVIGRLSFSHICEIEWIDDPLVRYFYEQECMRCTWSVRELRRQIGTNLHIRVGLSKDPEKCLSPYKRRGD